MFQLPGQNLSNAPEFVATTSFSYTPPIGSSGLRALFYVDARHSGTFNTGSDLDLEKTQKSFDVVNARIGLRGPDNMWAVEVWSQNLFNQNYKQVAFDVPLQGSCTQNGALNNFCSPVPGRSTQLFGAFLGEPRTYGLTLRGRLGQPKPVPVAEPEPLPPPPPPPPAPTQTCSDGTVILATAVGPPPPPPPPPPPEPERG